MEVYSETATVEDAKLKTCTLKDTRKKKKDTRKSYYFHRCVTYEPLSPHIKLIALNNDLHLSSHHLHPAPSCVFAVH